MEKEKRKTCAIESRVENRRSNCSLPVVSRLGFRLVTSVRFGLVLFPVPAHRTGLADFPHPSRKRLTLSPTEGSRSGVVTGPSHTQSEETLPEIVCMPVVALCVCRITTDAASGGRCKSTGG